jgi:hypothetical protein
MEMPQSILTLLKSEVLSDYLPHNYSDELFDSVRNDLHTDDQRYAFGISIKFLVTKRNKQNRDVPITVEVTTKEIEVAYKYFVFEMALEELRRLGNPVITDHPTVENFLTCRPAFIGMQ